jgi:hypothetical protein
MCEKCGCKYEQEDGTCTATGNVFDDTWPKDAMCELSLRLMIKREANEQEND